MSIFQIFLPTFTRKQSSLKRLDVLSTLPVLPHAITIRLLLVNRGNSHLPSDIACSILLTLSIIRVFLN